MRKKGKFRTISIVLTFLLLGQLILPGLGMADPAGGSVVGGSATIDQLGSTTTINQASDQAIINWQQFGVNQGSLVQFLQPSQLAVALNRVTGGDPSAILGSLNANGSVFVLNPNGVIFGAGSQVNVGGAFLASTLSMSNQDFLNRNYLLSQDPSKALGAIINQGNIHADSVALAAPLVLNDGVVSANRQVALAGTTKATISFDSRNLIQFIDVNPVAAPGSVLIPAAAADAVLKYASNNKAFAAATSLSKNSDGSYSLSGAVGYAANSGKISADRVEVSGNHVSFAGGQINAKTLIIDPVDSNIYNLAAGTVLTDLNGINLADVANGVSSVTLLADNSITFMSGGTWNYSSLTLAATAGSGGISTAAGDSFNFNGITLTASGSISAPSSFTVGSGGLAFSGSSVAATSPITSAGNISLSASTGNASFSSITAPSVNLAASLGFVTNSAGAAVSGLDDPTVTVNTSSLVGTDSRGTLTVTTSSPALAQNSQTSINPSASTILNISFTSPGGLTETFSMPVSQLNQPFNSPSGMPYSGFDFGGPLPQNLPVSPELNLQLPQVQPELQPLPGVQPPANFQPELQPLPQVQPELQPLPQVQPELQPLSPAVQEANTPAVQSSKKPSEKAGGVKPKENKSEAKQPVLKPETPGGNSDDLEEGGGPPGPRW